MSEDVVLFSLAGLRFSLPMDALMKSSTFVHTLALGRQQPPKG